MNKINHIFFSLAISHQLHRRSTRSNAQEGDLHVYGEWRIDFDHDDGPAASSVARSRDRRVIELGRNLFRRRPVSGGGGMQAEIWIAPDFTMCWNLTANTQTCNSPDSATEWVAKLSAKQSLLVWYFTGFGRVTQFAKGLLFGTCSLCVYKKRDFRCFNWLLLIRTEANACSPPFLCD